MGFEPTTSSLGIRSGAILSPVLITAYILMGQAFRHCFRPGSGTGFGAVFGVVSPRISHDDFGQNGRQSGSRRPEWATTQPTHLVQNDR